MSTGFRKHRITADGFVGGLALLGVAGVASAQGRSGKASFTQVVDGGEAPGIYGNLHVKSGAVLTLTSPGTVYTTGQNAADDGTGERHDESKIMRARK